MNREDEIIVAIVELSLLKSSIDLDSIRVQIQSSRNISLPPSWEVTARQVLRTLAGLGYVTITSGQAIKLTENFLGSSLQERIKNNDGSAADNFGDLNSLGTGENDGRGDPPKFGGGSGDEEGGGEGFREVLAHPYLFALPKDEFNKLLEAI